MKGKETVRKQKRNRSPRAVILSKRANVFYLEHCRVFQEGQRVVYQIDTQEDVSQLFNIPDKNTIFLLLGRGTSITQAAIRTLSESNVLVGFTGSGGSPLISSVDPVFLLPQEEYRPTQYMQAWVKMWLDEEQRIHAAKKILNLRLTITEEHWEKMGIHIPDQILEDFEDGIKKAKDVTELLTAEGRWAKELYKTLCKKYEIQGFTREEGKRNRSNLNAVINAMLDHGNYLAYGYAAAALHTLGISYAFPVLHGKTRKGALVFDIADLYKDSLIMPNAFKLGVEGKTDQEFRGHVIQTWQKTETLDKMMNHIKNLASEPSDDPF